MSFGHILNNLGGISGSAADITLSFYIQIGINITYYFSFRVFVFPIEDFIYIRMGSKGTKGFQAGCENYLAGLFHNSQYLVHKKHRCFYDNFFLGVPAYFGKMNGVTDEVRFILNVRGLIVVSKKKSVYLFLATSYPALKKLPFFFRDVFGISFSRNRRHLYRRPKINFGYHLYGFVGRQNIARKYHFVPSFYFSF